MSLPTYITIEKALGETPLQATERARIEHGILEGVPLAYAGRLDPMATGQLLILVGDECKVQEKYHRLDKEYSFEVLLGVRSDTHDILGIVESTIPLHPDEAAVTHVLRSLQGEITLPYPHFSAKTVKGKPLHMWTLEKRLHEITIPTKTSHMYLLRLNAVRHVDTPSLYADVITRIETIPPVTDPRKELGKDFRRDEVRASWKNIYESLPRETFTILTLTCIASSGTYMRTLASVIGERLGTHALAYSIHRTRIGVYTPLPLVGGFWRKTYAP